MAEVGKLRGDTIGLVGKLFGAERFDPIGLGCYPHSAIRRPRSPITSVVNHPRHRAD